MLMALSVTCGQGLCFRRTDGCRRDCAPAPGRGVSLVYGIENIAEYIDSRLEEKIRVDEIAKICHMSYSGFAAKFREQYGMSCKEYIERMRIFKSEEYLLFTDHDLTYISRLTGFADCSHFIRTFRKYRGMTPKQFRMKSRKME